MAKSDLILALQDASNAARACYWKVSDRDTQTQIGDKEIELFRAITLLNQEDIESRTTDFAAAVKGAKIAIADLKKLADSIITIQKDTAEFASLVSTVGKAAIALQAL